METRVFEIDYKEFAFVGALYVVFTILSVCMLYFNTDHDPRLFFIILCDTPLIALFWYIKKKVKYSFAVSSQGVELYTGPNKNKVVPWDEIESFGRVPRSILTALTLKTEFKSKYKRGQYEKQFRADIILFGNIKAKPEEVLDTLYRYQRLHYSQQEFN